MDPELVVSYEQNTSEARTLESILIRFLTTLPESNADLEDNTVSKKADLLFIGQKETQLLSLKIRFYLVFIYCTV